MSQLSKAVLDSSQMDSEKFRSLAEKTADFLNGLGMSVLPYRAADLPLFNSLPLEKRKHSVQYLESFHGVLEMMKKNGVDFKNNSKALWEGIKVMGFRPPSDLFGFLKDDHKIEVYNAEGIQIWRNLGVMSICSYTLEEMYCMDWQDRYARNESDTKQIISMVQTILSGKVRNTIPAMIGDHTVIEKSSINQYVLKASHDYFCPLFNEYNQVRGFVVTSLVEIVGSAKLQPELLTDSPAAQP